jgi:hypothetical protein
MPSRLVRVPAPAAGAPVSAPKANPAQAPRARQSNAQLPALGAALVTLAMTSLARPILSATGKSKL